MTVIRRPMTSLAILQTLFYRRITRSIRQIPALFLLFATLCGTHSYAQDGQGLLVSGAKDFRILLPDGRVEGAFLTGSSPAWSPDRKQIVFQNNTNHALIIADAFGSTLQTIPYADEVTTLSWPCSNQIFIQPSLSYITISDKKTHSISPPKNLIITSADVSHDCQHIVYSASTTKNGSVNLYVSRLDGTDIHQLTSGYIDGSPLWSPDGLSIAFIRFMPWHRFAPSSVYQLLGQDPPQKDAPAWQSDNAFFVGDLYTVRADGSALTQVASATSHISALSWSPDGKYFAVVTPWNTTYEIWVISSTETQRKLIYQATDLTQSDWGEYSSVNW